MEAIELNLRNLSHQFKIYGLDEVGRGPLAGPVVSCCCAYSGDFSTLKMAIESCLFLGVGDSKKLSEKKRQKILDFLNIPIAEIRFGEVYSFLIGEGRFSFSLSEVTHKEIDDINILQASLKSMELAFDCVNNTLEDGDTLIWVDGNKIPNKIKNIKGSESIVKGDSKSFVIALASIIAKQKRDFLMRDYAALYPGYGFEKHAGYPTQKHKEAIRLLGPCPIHRLSFKGVK